MGATGMYPLGSPADSPVGAFVQGAMLPFRAIRFLAGRPRLWGYVAVPLAINMALFAVLLFLGGSWFADRLREWISSWSDATWYGRVALIVFHMAFWTIVLVAVYFVFTPVSLLVAAPFSDQLGERVERACGFAVCEARPFWRAIAEDAWFALVSAAKRLGIALAVFAGLLPLHLVPLVGSVAYGVLSFVWVVVVLVLEFSGYPADRRHWGLRRKWGLAWSRRAASAGFGLTAALLLMIPFVNVLMVPVCVVAGTFLFGMAERSATGPKAVAGP